MGRLLTRLYGMVQRVIKVVAMIKGHFGGHAAITYNVSLVESYHTSGYFQGLYIIMNGLSFSNLYFNFTNDSCRLFFYCTCERFYISRLN